MDNNGCTGRSGCPPAGGPMRVSQCRPSTPCTSYTPAAPQERPRRVGMAHTDDNAADTNADTMKANASSMIGRNGSHG